MSRSLRAHRSFLTHAIRSRRPRGNGDRSERRHAPISAWVGVSTLLAGIYGSRVRKAASPSAGFLPVDESLLDFVGVAGDGIVGLEHREPALIVSQEIARKAFRAASAAASAR